MNLLTPHAERRLQAPLRTLAQSGKNWRGLSRRKLAEQYAWQRAEMNEAMKMAWGHSVQKSAIIGFEKPTNTSAPDAKLTLVLPI